MKKGWKSVAILGAAALSLSFTAGSGRAGELLDRVMATKSINIGFANEAPYAYKQPDGTLAGFSYDLAKLVLSKMGVTDIQSTIVPFGSLIPALTANRFDMIVAGLGVRPARCQQVAFSELEMQYSDTLIVPPGNPKHLKSFDDLIKSGATLAAIQGGSSLADAQQAGVPADKISQFPGFPEMIGAVKSNRVDAAATTTVTAALAASQDGGKNFDYVKDWTPPVVNGKKVYSYTAYAFKKTDQDFVDAFNKQLLALRGSDEHKAILEKYNLPSSVIPDGAVTTAMICSQ